MKEIFVFYSSLPTKQGGGGRSVAIVPIDGKAISPGDGKYTLLQLLEWLTKSMDQGLFLDDLAVPSVNGIEGVDGWMITRELRTKMMVKAESQRRAEFVIVKTHVMTLKLIGPMMIDTVDFVRVYHGGKIRFWFEQKEGKNELIQDRKMSPVVVYKAVPLEKGSTPITVIFSCTQEERHDLIELLKSTEIINVEGMRVDASSANTFGHEKFLLAQKWSPVREDLGKATEVLKNIDTWRDLAPITDSAGVPVYGEIENALMLINALYVRRGVPALNLCIFSPSNMGKTTALEFLTIDMMGGSKIDATLASGKGWLPSFKEGVEPSAMFTEKNAILVDEFLKSLNTRQTDHSGYVLAIKRFFQEQMQLLEHDEVKGVSGNGSITGHVACSVAMTDNPDKKVILCLGKAFFDAPAAFRRMNFLVLEGMPFNDEDSMSKKQAHGVVRKKLMEKFGSMHAVRAMMFIMRRGCEHDWVVSKTWRKKVKEAVLANVLSSIPVPGYPNWFSNDMGLKDANEREKGISVLQELIRVQANAWDACWIGAAALIGLEMSKGKDVSEYELYFGEEQEELALRLAERVFKDNLRIYGDGIFARITETDGIARVPYGRMD